MREARVQVVEFRLLWQTPHKLERLQSVARLELEIE
jgi:hypothetical protein